MIVIHIGLHKTGTSTIQHFLEANDRALDALGIRFARIGRQHGYGHRTLARELVGSIHFRARAGTWAQVAALARQHPDRQILVSAEALTNLTHTQVAPLRQRLDGFPVRIVVYVRDFGTWVTSMYRQKTKTGRNLDDFDRFFAQMDERGRLDPFAIIEPWGRAFGWDDVAVRQLDGPLHGGELIADFLHVLGHDIAALPDIAPGSQTPRNVSAGWKVLETVRHIHGRKGGPRGPSRDGVDREGTRYDAAIQRTYKRLFESCLAAAKALGLNEAGQYLTAAQARRCREVYATAVDRFNAVGAGLEMPVPAADRERPFLPSFERIPPEELSQVLLPALLDALDADPASVRRRSGWLRRAEAGLGRLGRLARSSAA